MLAPHPSAGAGVLSPNVSSSKIQHPGVISSSPPVWVPVPGSASSLSWPPVSGTNLSPRSSVLGAEAALPGCRLTKLLRVQCSGNLPLQAEPTCGCPQSQAGGDMSLGGLPMGLEEPLQQDASVGCCLWLTSLAAPTLCKPLSAGEAALRANSNYSSPELRGEKSCAG